MTSTLSFDALSQMTNNDALSQMTNNDASWSSELTRAQSEATDPSNTDRSDDLSLTYDDLIVLSDLFDSANPALDVSKTQRKQATRSRPRSRKRRCSPANSDKIRPRSQQQRQKLEIELLKKQVVELEATLENLRERKLQRKKWLELRRPDLEIGSYDHNFVFSTCMDPIKTE
ncbi:hypothetical protein PsorP6_015041 [Peronosclerospora sorghi]|uniref:Uncharacterized protein n=1 Tax=Peronosclerospora sorghi TaxID=230839 RepID=A0ACC0VUL9_9STRA|nr:hypothetical protein PsorP6_015041 [Peronosclerospora sorghi]